jgi:GT2 family glycosyltransferase
MTEPAAISVVIVNWNSREHLAACLRSLQTQVDRDFETIVVDNGSTDGSLQMLADEFGWVKTVQTGQNLGFAEGANRGIEASQSPWVATLNNDTIVDRHWIEALRGAVAGCDDRLGMIQCRLVLRATPDRTNSTGVLLFRDGGARDRDFDVPIRPDDRCEEVFCPTAGAALYRRAMLDGIKLPTGYFDRTFFMYCEDVDLGWRARIAGWSAVYLPDAIVAHEFQASSRKHKNHFVSLHSKRNRLRMLLKNGSIAFMIRTLPKSLYDLCEAIVWQGPGVIAQFFQAVRDGLRERAGVNRILRVPRRQLELRWVTPKPRR